MAPVWRYVVCYSCRVYFDLGKRSMNTTVGEILDRLRPFFSDHLGCNVEIMNSKRYDGSELDQYEEGGEQ